MSFTTGDWVRFYRAGSLCIAVVEYIRPTNSGKIELITSLGSILEPEVLEARRIPIGPPELKDA